MVFFNEFPLDLYGFVLQSQYIESDDSGVYMISTSKSPNGSFPEIIQTEEELEELLSRPTPEVVQDIKELEAAR